MIFITLKGQEIEGCIISSVSPQITNVARLAAEKILKKDVMVVGPGLKTGLNIMLDNPSEMGADRVADAVAAMTFYPVPLVIVDMGTATTVSVVDEKKRFMGGMILPGVRVSLDALTARASQLSGISIEEPKRLIGRNTVDCMKSGILYGKRGGSGRHCGQDRRVSGTGCNRDRYRRNVKKDHSSLQKRNDLGCGSSSEGTSCDLRKKQIIKIPEPYPEAQAM